MTTRPKYHEKLTGLAHDAFADHCLMESAHNRWYIARARASTYWTEIVLLRGSRVVVHGDIEPVIFQANGSTVDSIRWLAASHTEYLAGKVIPSERAYAVDRDVAIADIAEKIAGGNRLDALAHAIISLRDGKNVERVCWDIFEGGLRDDAAWFAGVGKVIDPSVYYAHAALKKLAELLFPEAKDKANA